MAGPRLLVLMQLQICRQALKRSPSIRDTLKRGYMVLPLINSQITQAKFMKTRLPAQVTNVDDGASRRPCDVGFGVNSTTPVGPAVSPFG
jgi:hypothetical protein